MSTSTTTPPLSLDRQRNIKYWLRCVRTLLPSEYTSTDLSRTSLAFFCVNALDLLGELGTLVNDEERTNWIEWFYHCQHPIAGFRGSPATDLGELRNEENGEYDVGNLASTYFTLASLLALGDDLSRVRRKETLEWLRRLQRPDGGFVEFEGSTKEDVRFIHLAAAVRYLLRGANGLEGVEDIDIEACMKYLKATESFDHGFGGAPALEAHGGHTFCAIAAMSLLGRLPVGPQTQQIDGTSGLTNPDETLRWLLSRQQPLSMFEAFPGEEPEDPNITPGSVEAAGSISFAGFNGRCNKRTDTCYSFWVVGSLDILKKSHLVDAKSNRSFYWAKLHMLLEALVNTSICRPMFYIAS